MTKLPRGEELVNSLTNPLASRPMPLGTLLSAAGRRLGAELDVALEKAGFADLRTAHAVVFQFIEPAGSRLSDLAQSAGMTKQAMGELVRYLEAHEYVMVTPDDEDRRTKRVLLTGAGWRVIELGIRVIDDYEKRLEQSIGREGLQELRSTLELIRTGRAGL
jgi:DNA-binding MarR family transcriptional regulator